MIEEGPEGGTATEKIGDKKKEGRRSGNCAGPKDELEYANQR